MSDQGRLEKFRQRLERGVVDYRGCGEKLHAHVAAQLTELNDLCDGMVNQARRILRTECSVERHVMPYSLEDNTFMVRHHFVRPGASTYVDVIFAGGHFGCDGTGYAVNEYANLLDAVADKVLSFYLPR